MASKLIRTFQGQIGRALTKICGCCAKAKETAESAGDTIEDLKKTELPTSTVEEGGKETTDDVVEDEATPEEEADSGFSAENVMMNAGTAAGQAVVDKAEEKANKKFDEAFDKATGQSDDADDAEIRDVAGDNKKGKES